MDVASMSVRQLCGQLLVVGFEPPTLPDSVARALERGERGGVILFRRNIVEVDQLVELTARVHVAARPGAPPIVGVDEEGGRVRRLPAPCLRLPPMRRFGSIDQPDLTEQAASALGAELAALGFTLDFAPVLDVDSNPANPVIGDRSFGAEPDRVARHALAFARGLAERSVSSCGKHFPGHGDTSTDSHHELPWVGHEARRLRQLELVPFVEAARAPLPALMSAHVMYPALDPDAPATLSASIATDLLRGELGFTGVLFSDDMEMGAMTEIGDVGGAAVRAVRAGCDALLVCRDEARQELAFDALVREAERDGRFVERCRQAASRLRALRESVAARADLMGRGSVGEQVAHRRALLARLAAQGQSSAVTERIERECVSRGIAPG